MSKIAFLSSTGGTNLQSFIDARDRGELGDIEICCLITDQALCGAAEKARMAKIKVYYFDPNGLTPEVFQQSILDTLDYFEVDLVVMGGFMKILSPKIVEKYRDRIINVHPSLLPKYGGKMDMSIYQVVLDAGETQTGMTIHKVDEGIDTGEIILQKTVDVEPTDTVETLREKVQGLEKEWYPKVVKLFSVGELK